MLKLRREVDSKCSASENETVRPTADLPYLRAVCLEAMRIYPPLPLGLPRVVPEDGDTVDGYFIPAGVSGYFSPRPSPPR